MIYFLVVVQIISGIILIACVMLHSPSGDGLGGIGAPAKLFHQKKDMESGLNKVTGFFVFLFLLCAFILALHA